MKQHSDLWPLAEQISRSAAPPRTRSPCLAQPTGDLAMKHKSALDQLKHEFRRLQGSVNYWNNAARAAQRDADKHTGQRKDNDLKRLAESLDQAIAAQKQLDQVKAQLTELDPKGARARQLNALRSAIARANREIARFEHLAALPGQSDQARQHWQTRLANRKDKLQQLLDALTRHNSETASLANQQRNLADMIAATDRAYSCTPISTAAELMLGQAQTPEQQRQSAQQTAAVVQGLQTAIQDARRRGDLTRADQLQAALEYQLELAQPDGTTTH